jgi:hypothetical protein
LSLGRAALRVLFFLWMPDEVEEWAGIGDVHVHRDASEYVTELSSVDRYRESGYS